MLRPWISTNLAISADGKISSVSRRPSGWTSPDDHARLIDLRRRADALIVGRGTLESDRMTMTVPDSHPQPLRCIVSRNGMLDPEHPLFQRTGGAIHVLATAAIEKPVLGNATFHLGSLARFLQTLANDLGVKQLHCEGGGTLVRELAELDAIDEFHLTLAGHTLFGGLEAPTSTGLPDGFLSETRGFSLHRFDPKPESGECFLSYLRKGSPGPAQ